MTAWAGLLPFADAPDLPERFQRLDDHLRKAPATGDGSEIFDLAWDAFLALPEEPTTEARAMCLLGIARNRYLRGLPFDGIEPANHAVAVAERLKNDLVLAKCLKMLGLMYMETGNFPAAMTALTRALPAARNAGDSDQESGIFNNLGLAHQYCGPVQHGHSVLRAIDRGLGFGGDTPVDAGAPPSKHCSRVSLSSRLLARIVCRRAGDRTSARAER